MKSEPLNISNKKFLVNRLIQQAPITTLVREFFKNAQENALLGSEDRRIIKVYPVEIDGVPKLAFWNTGVGMSDDELRRATDISSSINKEMSLNSNFGIGAKVSGLTMSRSGIRYRSCKDGSVHEVVIGFDEEEDTYVRFSAELPDGSIATVYEVTSIAENEGQPLDHDWTEVVLFGEDEEHDTVRFPLGKSKTKLDRSYIPTAIFRRFAEFGDFVEVRIDVAMTKGGGKGDTGHSRQLKTLQQVLDKVEHHELVSDPDTGIAVRYIHDPKHDGSGHSVSARANPATGSTTFCAIVHKGERYDFKTRKAWSSAAPNFGIPFGSRVLTVEILIPDDMAMPSQYREALTWPEDRAPMVSEDFAIYVQELMPEWVKDVIRAESPNAPEDLNDLQKDLQRLLDEFRVPTSSLKLKRPVDEDRVENSSTGEDTTGAAPIPVGDPSGTQGESDGGGDAARNGGQRSQNKKVRKAPEGAVASKVSKALERVPEIKILTDPEDINEKSMKGRAARYYGESQTLFVNGLYPAVDRLVVELEKELATECDDPQLLRDAALHASRRSVAFRVGKATCYAISKRLSDDWSADALDTATSPESLSLAADDYKQSLSEAKRFAKMLIKADSVETEAA